jgi:DNA primase
MKIGENYYNCNLNDVLDELANQLESNGIQLLKKRNNLQTHIMVQCPYHGGGQEKKPSAGIRKSDGKFHCFACNEVHSLPEVISFCFGKYDDILGKFGNKWLQKNFQHLEVEQREVLKLDMSRSSIKKTVNYITENELDSYRYTHKYMYERGLTDEIIELFDIGYDSNTDSITFPVRDISGHCLFVARRKVKYKQYEYPKGVEKPLYGLYELSTLSEPAEEIIICEGMFDALSCWVHGKYAVALNGVGTELQFKQLRGLHARKLILATDMDKAGLRARARIRENVTNKIITEYVWDKSIAKDINAMEEQYFLELQEIF